ncbi:MAG: MFS transporter, partial [Angustibacter sp.]
MVDAARARAAVATTFVVSGVFLATWLGRVPDIRDAFGFSLKTMGVVLFAFAVGAVVGLPLSARVIRRLGPGGTVRASMSVATGGLVLLALAPNPVTLVAGLVIFGFGSGVCDVAMNVAGAQVEQVLGRSLLPRLHALFSLGSVAGAALAAGASALDVRPRAHLAAVAILGGLAVYHRASRFLPGEPQRAATGRRSGVWGESRTWLLGLLVLSFSFAEGTGNDWIGLAIVDGYAVSNALGTIGFGLFVSAMTAGRLLGPRLLDRYGRVAVLRGCAAWAALGVTLVAFGDSLALGLIGAVCWGLGASLGFPVGMS